MDGASLDLLKSKKVPRNSTTGIRGVYYIKGKYHAKIRFQKKTFALGAYDTIEEAADARRQAEQVLIDKVVKPYEVWKTRAEEEPVWAQENPVRIHVEKQGNKLVPELVPELEL